MTFLEALLAAISAMAAHADGEDPPAAVLWPDSARQWEPIVAALRERAPVLTLGPYEPAQWTGPAYWIRCVVDGELPGPTATGIPVIYLPGISRAEIRAVEEAPSHIKALAELQYRGEVFSQANGRDWTIAAFLQADGRGGLGISVKADDATRSAILRARSELVDLPIEYLRKSAPLKAGFFDGLLTRDLTAQILRWIDDPKAFQDSLGEERWTAFRESFRDMFGFDVDNGPLAAAEQLGRRDSDAWQGAWVRFAEAPQRYTNLPERLRAAKPKSPRRGQIFYHPDSWPQDNEEDEDALRAALAELRDVSAAEARRRIRDLETSHAPRRTTVWAELGKAPLSRAVGHLAEVARVTERILVGDSLSELTANYSQDGWRADDSVMRALECVAASFDVDAVTSAARSIYKDWLEESARRWQAALTADPGSYRVEPVDWPDGTCVLFTDGLRLDVAKRLEKSLLDRSLEVELRVRLTALPSVTPTAKPAVSPIAQALGPGQAFAPAPAEGGADVGAESLRRHLTAAGYQVLEQDQIGDPAGKAWTELADIDKLGHEHTAKLPTLLEGEVRGLAERIAALIKAGWQRVAVVTDHGWLYLPGGLPKADLPQHLTKDEHMRKGRAARLATGATVDILTVAWYWHSSVRIALAPGISSFVAGATYEHGGATPQECVTPVLVVAPGRQAKLLEIEVQWRGLRIDVAVVNAAQGMTIDLRKKAGDSASSIIGGQRSVGVDGNVSALVSDDSLEGTSVFVVALDRAGGVLAQRAVTIGGDK